MNLTPREKDKLLISMAAMVARRRLERGVKLNYPEAIALITDFVVEKFQKLAARVDQIDLHPQIAKHRCIFTADDARAIDRERARRKTELQHSVTVDDAVIKLYFGRAVGA